MNADLLVLGSINLDVVLHPVDNLPSGEDSIVCNKTTMGVGGCAANTAVVLSKLGVSAAVIGKVGKDKPAGTVEERANSQTIYLTLPT